jgi:GxxExxY protein
MQRDPQTHAVIGAALEVHNVLGPGYLEAVYQEALEIEFDLREIPHVVQPQIPVEYKGRQLTKYYQPDFLVFDRVVLEIKAQLALGSVEEAQIINSLRCCRKEVGLLINFGATSLEWKRFVNTVR